MSEPENFVARWSRLKREAAKDTETEAVPVPSPLPPGDAESVNPEPAKAAPPEPGTPPEQAFDPASLPPIESITADSDIRAFLQSGVPADLTKAALRRAWTADPAIRDFIGIAENQWDFTDPTAMPGFGSLEATDDVRQLVAQAMGKLGETVKPITEQGASDDPSKVSASAPAAAPPSSIAQTTFDTQSLPQVSGMPERNEIGAVAEESVEGQRKMVSVAPQHVDETAKIASIPSRRSHGKALPQ